VTVLTDVPDELRLRGIAPAAEARGFTITLDVAEPWGGGALAGRVERTGRRDERPIEVEVRCSAAWLDLAPQLLGKKRLLSWTTLGDLRNRAVPIWLDDEVHSDRLGLEPLVEANWRPFSFELPDGLPRALEGTFVSFRWRIGARRRRLVGYERVSFPILLSERPVQPTVRIETSPLGTWRLLEWKSEDETDGDGGGCSVRYEPRRPEDMPLPGETREAELGRRTSA
jgi:hypothetical protein